jgi:hypothetical protein
LKRDPGINRLRLQCPLAPRFFSLRKTIAPEAAGPELPQGVFAFQASLFRWRAFDMIWHQMRARSAIAAAFFTIALLRYRKTVVQTA